MNKKNEQEKKIPDKNYIKVITIFFITIVIIIIAFLSYRSYIEYEKNIPILRGKISEIKEENIENYFKENDDFFLYVGVANDENCREIENELLETLKRRKISNIVYLNLTDTTNRGNVYKNLNETYSSQAKLEAYPALIIVNDKKIVDIVQRKDRKINIGDIEQFLEFYGYEVIE